MTCVFPRFRRCGPVDRRGRGRAKVRLVRPRSSRSADRRPSGRVDGGPANSRTTIRAGRSAAARAERRGGEFPRQLPDLGSRSVPGRPEGRRGPSAPAGPRISPPAHRYLCPRAPADRSRAARRAPCWPRRSSRSASPPCCRWGWPASCSSSTACPPGARGCPGSRSGSGSSSCCSSGCGWSATTPGWRWPRCRPRSSAPWAPRCRGCCGSAPGRRGSPPRGWPSRRSGPAGRWAGCPGGGWRTRSPGRRGRRRCRASG